MGHKRKIHFTGITHPILCDLAVALKSAGDDVTGSDSSSPDPKQQSMLGAIPVQSSWNPAQLTAGLDAVVISPIVTRDNPELHRALELKVPVYSYPEFIHLECRNKHRVVVTGSHGKTMITSLILHVLNYHNRSFDYVISRASGGLTTSVKLTNAPVIIIEGQDGLASALDPTTIFLKYQHHIGIICGIEWIASPAYPTKEEYTRQFSQFEMTTPKGGVLIYFDLEPVVTALSKVNQPDVLYIPYKTHPSIQEGGQEFLLESAAERHRVKLSGKVNMQNIAAAKETLKKLGITTPMFYAALQDFGGDAI